MSKLWDIYNQIELPLVPIIVAMEEYGAQIDQEQVKKLTTTYTIERDRVDKEIQEMAGYEFNVKSPQQVSDFLFSEKGIGLPIPRIDGRVPITETGYVSTDSTKVLEQMESHPSIILIREFRMYEKLISTYLVELGNPHPISGKVHTHFNQTRTRSYRLSSSDRLNFQNIPVKTDHGKLLRATFIGTPGNVIFKADYDQMELRAETALSRDEAKLAIYEVGGDIHGEAALVAFGNRPDYTEHAKTYRKYTKNGIFSMLYRSGIGKRSAAMGLTFDETKAFTKAMESLFAGSEAYFHDVVKELHKLGYAETLFGHRRHLPHIKSVRKKYVADAEREGYNHIVQSLCAGIMKRAMVNLDAEMQLRGMKSRCFIQVHDELVFDALPSEVPLLFELVERVFSDVPELDIEMKASSSIGPNWLAADYDENEIKTDGSNLHAVLERVTNDEQQGSI
tara:strand:- start:1487 stop:2836 length:1350 start_codon:yes stop_codon:yes gene_type:complete